MIKKKKSVLTLPFIFTLIFDRIDRPLRGQFKVKLQYKETKCNESQKDKSLTARMGNIKFKTKLNTLSTLPQQHKLSTVQPAYNVSEGAIISNFDLGSKYFLQLKYIYSVCAYLILVNAVNYLNFINFI